VGALSDERSGLSFVSQSSVLVSIYIYTMYFQNITEIVLNIQYVQGLCLSRLSTTVIGVFTDTLPRNGLQNTVVLLLRTLPINSRCLQRRCLAMGAYAILLLLLLHSRNVDLNSASATIITLDPVTETM
jgi:hypothetical protein